MQNARRTFVLVSALLLLVLDAGRSFYARSGSSTPTSLISPDPSQAVPIAWPPGVDVPSGAPLGERLYAEHCAICHGPDGRGNGPTAPSLHPRPRDFSGGVFKIKSIPGARAPTLEDIRRLLRLGMPGTSMPGWGDILGDDEIDAVANYVLDLGPHREWTPAEHVKRPTAEIWNAASAEVGEKLYDDLGCPSCHGMEGQGDGPSAKDLQDVWRQPAPSRDLTAPWTFRGGSDREAAYARIAHGVSGTPMPGYLDVVDPQEIASVVVYMQSLARTPPWQPGATAPPSGAPAATTARGEYLVRAGMCGMCHTAVDAHGLYLSGSHHLAGGMKITAGGHGIFFARNLTADPDTGLGRWSVDEIAAAIRTGHTPERRLNLWAMPWMILGLLTAEDAAAMATYLKSLPPVYNRVPDPLHYGFVETVARKLAYAWPALVPNRLAYYPGNFAESAPGGRSRTAPQTILVWAQLIIMGATLLLLPFVPATPGSERRSGGLKTLVFIAFIVLAGVASFVYWYPAVRWLPPATVIAAIDSTIPDPPAATLSESAAALLQRGRYLYATSSCAYCHNGNGAGGGKVNYALFGTTWARNLTPHPSGLGEWPDDAVRRAMISGVSRDGRAIHWQAMNWDHVSNYSVEDQYALLGYLRSLPPLDRELPAPIPPRPDDCAGDTFWIGKTNIDAGCR